MAGGGLVVGSGYINSNRDLRYNKGTYIGPWDTYSLRDNTPDYDSSCFCAAHTTHKGVYQGGIRFTTWAPFDELLQCEEDGFTLCFTG